MGAVQAGHIPQVPLVPPAPPTQRAMAAGEPFELVAAGPAGPDVTVEYFDAGEPLRVLARHDANPFRVTLEARAPGLHAIYAVTTTADGSQEISRPVTVFFQRRP